MYIIVNNKFVLERLCSEKIIKTTFDEKLVDVFREVVVVCGSRIYLYVF